MPPNLAPLLETESALPVDANVNTEATITQLTWASEPLRHRNMDVDSGGRKKSSTSDMDFVLPVSDLAPAAISLLRSFDSFLPRFFPRAWLYPALPAGSCL